MRRDLRLKEKISRPYTPVQNSLASAWFCRWHFIPCTTRNCWRQNSFERQCILPDSRNRSSGPSGGPKDASCPLESSCWWGLRKSSFERQDKNYAHRVSSALRLACWQQSRWTTRAITRYRNHEPISPAMPLTYSCSSWCSHLGGFSFAMKVRSWCASFLLAKCHVQLQYEQFFPAEYSWRRPFHKPFRHFPSVIMHTFYTRKVIQLLMFMS